MSTPEPQKMPKTSKEDRFTASPAKREIQWHYHRWDLAKRYLKSMQTGARPGIALFAERRQGKTDFIRKDVAPLAESMNAAVVYVDFWASDVTPPNAFYQGVERAVERYNKELGLKLTSLEVGVPKALKATFQVRDREQEADLLYRCFEKLREIGRPVVLLLDEVQQLAVGSENVSFVRALRSQLQTNSSIVNPIYTGSSQQLLAELFKSTKAALYQAANIEQLPSLDGGFVDYVLDVAQKHCDSEIYRNDAIAAFRKGGNRPRVLTDLLVMKINGGGGNLCSLFEYNKDSLLEVGAGGVSAQWSRMTQMDRAILRILASGQDRGFYTPATLSLIESLGVSNVKINKPNIQASLKRLEEKHKSIFSTEHGSWLFLDSLDRAWVVDTKLSEDQRQSLGLSRG